MPDPASALLPGMLLPGERVLFVTRRHPILILPPLLFLLLSYVLIAADLCPIALALKLDGRCPWVSAAAFLFAGIVLFLDWWATRYVLTSERLLRVATPVWQRSESLRLPGITSLSVRVGILGRLLGYGEVRAESTATHGSSLRLDFAPRPAELQDRIAQAIAAREVL